MVGGGRWKEMDIGIAFFKRDGTVRECNEMFRQTLRLEDVPERVASLTLLLGEEGRQLLYELRKDGSWSGPMLKGRCWGDAYRIEEEYWLLLDCSEVRQRRMRAYIDVYRKDRSTGLPSLQALYDALEERYLGEGAYGALYVLAFDDVYRFENSCGDTREERVLRKLADRLEQLREDGDYLAYIGSDKFVYVRPGVQQVQEAEETAHRLLHHHAEALAVEGELFYLNLAIGIALYPFDSHDAGELVRLGEKAMREARNNGWNRYAFYHRLESETRIDRLERLRRELPEAIEREEIYFVFQPQYDAAAGRYSGAEMLVRWRHREFGELSPGLFLPLAEQSGMIRFITIRALTQASRVFERLEAMERSDFSLSVNLSPTTLFHRDFLENLRFFLEHYGLRGRALHIEITEDVLAHNMEVMRETLDALKAMGIGIEIDDYGTGYTSLSTLIDLPVDKVKIDRKFVTGIDRDTKTETIYRAMLSTAQALGLNVVAEGVETDAEYRKLETIAPVTIQGWYIARPMEEKALYEFLERASF